MKFESGKTACKTPPALVLEAFQNPDSVFLQSQSSAELDFKRFTENLAPLDSTKISEEIRLIFVSSLLEIEQAADVLPIEQKKELVAFLLTRLRVENDELPPVRDIPKETIDAWVADDEEGYKKFLAGS